MFPGFPMACLTSAIEPLRAANEITGRREFVWRLVAETRAPVRSSAEIGLTPTRRCRKPRGWITCTCSPPDRRVRRPPPQPGPPALAGPHRDDAGRLFRRHLPPGPRGLMEGRPCSVHWCYEAAFKAEFPEVRRQRGDDPARPPPQHGLRCRRGVRPDAEADRGTPGPRLHDRGRLLVPAPLRPRRGRSQKVPVARAGGTTDSLPAPIREAIRLFETHVEDPLRIPMSPPPSACRGATSNGCSSARPGKARCAITTTCG
jgi:hypothetical protein